MTCLRHQTRAHVLPGRAAPAPVEVSRFDRRFLFLSFHGADNAA